MSSSLKEYRYVVILCVISVGVQIKASDYSLEQTIGSTIFLFLGSLLLSGGAVGLHRKYNSEASHTKWWFWIYFFMILIAAIPK